MSLNYYSLVLNCMCYGLFVLQLRSLKILSITLQISICSNNYQSEPGSNPGPGTQSINPLSLELDSYLRSIH